MSQNPRPRWDVFVLDSLYVVRVQVPVYANGFFVYIGEVANLRRNQLNEDSVGMRRDRGMSVYSTTTTKQQQKKAGDEHTVAVVVIVADPED